VKRRLSVLVCAGVLAACLALVGCGKTDYPDPALGPVVKTGRNAVMPMVEDSRAWPTKVTRKKTPHIRIFATEITQRMRQGLLQKGLFAALPTPESPAAKGVGSEFKVVLNTFSVSQISPNTWVVPHMLFNGLLLPAYTATSLATAGDVDLGGYIFPSNSVATVLKLKVSWLDKGIKSPILERTYQTKVELGAASERTLYKETIELTRQEGLKALDLMVNTVARDPHWVYLDSYRTLAQAQNLIDQASSPAAAPAGRAPHTPTGDVREAKSVPYKMGVQPIPGAPSTSATATKAAPKIMSPREVEAKLAAGSMALGAVHALAFGLQEAKALLDPYFAAEKKVGFVNDLRAQLIGLKYASQLSDKQKITKEEVEKIYDDPAVQRSLVVADLAKRAFDLAADTIGDPQLNSGSGTVQTGLLAKLAGQPRLQQLFLAEADKAVGTSWPLMKAFLQKVESPLVREYLKKRQ